MSFTDRMKGVWKRLKDFWATNMEREHKAISRTFGAFLVITILVIFGGLSLTVMGETANWGFIMAEIIGGLSVFLVVLASSFFGNDKKNGNSEEKKPEE